MKNKLVPSFYLYYRIIHLFLYIMRLKIFKKMKHIISITLEHGKKMFAMCFSVKCIFYYLILFK